MLKDRFDRCMAGALMLVLLALGGLLATAAPSAGRQGDGLERRLEQELQMQARLAFLERRYGPVVTMRDQGELQSALLKLEELERDFPGEPHGALLRGDLLHRLGQVEQAVASLALAVRGNGDYVDARSPLSQRQLVSVVAEQGVPLLRDRLRGQPADSQTAQVLKDAYYLRSRLAGGCE